MIEKLDHLVDDISGVNSKLILLIGPPRSGKSDLLGQLAERRQARVLERFSTVLNRRGIPLFREF